jgi:hypothetical protein
MSQAKSGIKRGPRPPEVSAKISAARKGRKMSDEQKMKLSIARRAFIVKTRSVEILIG